MNEFSPEKIAELEAIIFYYGEPIDLGTLSTLLHLSSDECAALVERYSELLHKEPMRGLMLFKNGGKVQMVTKPAFRDIGKTLMREEFREELTPAALETLAIVAYCGPISRPTIDYLRGVNSSFILRNLLVRGLVERQMNPKKGNRYEYLPSFSFLKHIGMEKASLLPEYERYRNLIAEFESQTAPKEENHSL